MSGAWMGIGIMAIGFGSLLIAVVGTVAMTRLREFKHRRAAPTFTIEEEEDE